MRKQRDFWGSFSVTLRPPSKAFADLQCGELHTRQEPCCAAFLDIETRCNTPSHYSSEVDYQKKSRQRHLPRELPIYLHGP